MTMTKRDLTITLLLVIPGALLTQLAYLGAVASAFEDTGTAATVASEPAAKSKPAPAATADSEAECMAALRREYDSPGEGTETLDECVPLTSARREELLERLVAEVSGAGPTTKAPAAPAAPARPGSDDVTAETSCEYLLNFDDSDDPKHELVASAFVSNDGGANAVVQVTATWRQSGGKAITQVRKVTVAGHASDVEVQFSKPANNRVIDRIQALPSEKQCTVSLELLNG